MTNFMSTSQKHDRVWNSVDIVDYVFLIESSLLLSAIE
jgi:hypothetical protein